MLSRDPGPEVIKLFSCSAQLRLKFILLINVKMPTIVGILTFISRINYRLSWSKPEISIYFIYEQLKFHAQLSVLEKSFITLGPGVLNIQIPWVMTNELSNYVYLSKLTQCPVLNVIFL